MAVFFEQAINVDRFYRKSCFSYFFSDRKQNSWGVTTSSSYADEKHNYINPMSSIKKPKLPKISTQSYRMQHISEASKGNKHTNQSQNKEQREAVAPFLSFNIGLRRRFVHQFWLTERGQKLEFEFQFSESSISKRSFIYVEFPELCILRKRKITIEIFVPSLSQSTQLNDDWVLASAVVDISQPGNDPFLRKVKVQVPLVRKLDESYVIKNHDIGKVIRVDAGTATIESFKFSPVGVALKTKQVCKWHNNQKSLFVE